MCNDALMDSSLHALCTKSLMPPSSHAFHAETALPPPNMLQVFVESSSPYADANADVIKSLGVEKHAQNGEWTQRP